MCSVYYQLIFFFNLCVLFSFADRMKNSTDDGFCLAKEERSSIRKAAPFKNRPVRKCSSIARVTSTVCNEEKLETNEKTIDNDRHKKLFTNLGTKAFKSNNGVITSSSTQANTHSDEAQAVSIRSQDQGNLYDSEIIKHSTINTSQLDMLLSNAIDDPPTSVCCSSVTQLNTPNPVHPPQPCSTLDLRATNSVITESAKTDIASVVTAKSYPCMSSVSCHKGNLASIDSRNLLKLDNSNQCSSTIALKSTLICQPFSNNDSHFVAKNIGHLDSTSSSKEVSSPACSNHQSMENEIVFFSGDQLSKTIPCGDLSPSLIDNINNNHIGKRSSSKTSPKISSFGSSADITNTTNSLVRSRVSIVPITDSFRTPIDEKKKSSGKSLRQVTASSISYSRNSLVAQNSSINVKLNDTTHLHQTPCSVTSCLKQPEKLPSNVDLNNILSRVTSSTWQNPFIAAPSVRSDAPQPLSNVVQSCSSSVNSFCPPLDSTSDFTNFSVSNPFSFGTSPSPKRCSSPRTSPLLSRTLIQEPTVHAVTTHTKLPESNPVGALSKAELSPKSLVSTACSCLPPVKRSPPCLSVPDISSHLKCSLCKGYLVDATSIELCLHTCE